MRALKLMHQVPLIVRRTVLPYVLQDSELHQRREATVTWVSSGSNVLLFCTSATPILTLGRLVPGYAIVNYSIFHQRQTF